MFEITIFFGDYKAVYFLLRGAAFKSLTKFCAAGKLKKCLSQNLSFEDAAAEAEEEEEAVIGLRATFPTSLSHNESNFGLKFNSKNLNFEVAKER